MALPSTPEQPRDRGWEISSDLAAGIVVLGSSLSHGDWPKTMGAALRTCGLEVGPVTQITRPGAHSGWGRGQISAVIAARPALVLVEFAINDADLRDGLSLKESRATHQEILQALSEAPGVGEVVLMTMSPAKGLRGALRPFLGRYYAMTRQLAMEREAGLIDLYPRWQAHIARVGAGEVMPDGLHPTAEAVASVALPVIVDQVARASGGASCAL